MMIVPVCRSRSGASTTRWLGALAGVTPFLSGQAGAKNEDGLGA
jgi:hypothetical protein